MFFLYHGTQSLGLLKVHYTSPLADLFFTLHPLADLFFTLNPLADLFFTLHTLTDLFFTLHHWHTCSLHFIPGRPVLYTSHPGRTVLYTSPLADLFFTLHTLADQEVKCKDTSPWQTCSLHFTPGRPVLYTSHPGRPGGEV